MARHGREPIPKTPPGDPADLLINQLEGFQHPQFLPGNPHRLPPASQRLRFPVSTLIGSPGSGLNIAPDPLIPTYPDAVPTIDPWHVASMISLYIPVPQTVVQVPFLTQPASRRNLLILRNDSLAANIFIDFAKSASAQSALRIAPGQTFLFDEVVPQDDLYCFADAAAGNLAFSYSNIA